MTTSIRPVATPPPPPPPEPGVAPVDADSGRDLVELLRSRLVTPSRRELKLALRWLLPSILITGVLVSVGDGPIGAGLAGLVILVLVTWRLPHFAGYIMIAASPWVVGFGRDQVLPLLRVNEALLAVILAVLAVRWLLYSRRIVLRLRSIDYAMLAVAVFGFFLPLIAQFVRLKPLGADDVFYAAVFLRLALLYMVVRLTIRDQHQVRTAMALSLVSATALGILGTMDSLNLGDTAQRLNRFFPNDGFIVDDGRGASTVGNPIGFGVYMAINAMIAISLYLSGERPQKVVAGAAVVCCIGVAGSGQIGPVLSFGVGLLALALVTKSFQRMVKLSIPFVLVVAILLAPLAQRRIEGFGGPEVDSRKREAIANSPVSEQGRQLFEANPGSSWDVRLYNLETFFIPEFADASNVFWGVTPQARVASPREGEEFIWIESGHLWLLWSGGIPLFLTWFGLLITGMVVGRRVLRGRAGPIGAAGAATFATMWIVNTAMIMDPHMTLRGTADILYPLLALCMCGAAYHPTHNPGAPAALKRPHAPRPQDVVGSRHSDRSPVTSNPRAR